LGRAGGKEEEEDDDDDKAAVVGALEVAGATGEPSATDAGVFLEDALKAGT
jgi:hypothetical protein